MQRPGRYRQARSLVLRPSLCVRLPHPVHCTDCLLFDVAATSIQRKTYPDFTRSSRHYTIAALRPTSGTRRSVAFSLQTFLVFDFGIVHHIPSFSRLMSKASIAMTSLPRVHVHMYSTTTFSTRAATLVASESACGYLPQIARAWRFQLTHLRVRSLAAQLATHDLAPPVWYLFVQLASVMSEVPRRVQLCSRATCLN